MNVKAWAIIRWRAERRTVVLSGRSHSTPNPNSPGFRPVAAFSIRRTTGPATRLAFGNDDGTRLERCQSFSSSMEMRFPTIEQCDSPESSSPVVQSSPVRLRTSHSTVNRSTMMANHHPDRVST